MSDTPKMPRSYDEDISREPWCNHDPAAVTNGICECGETVRQPILRLALPGIPARCGNCGEESETWPLGVYGGRVNATCPACFSIVAPVVAVAAGHYHDATGHEDTLCQCPSPGTYAPSWPPTQTAPAAQQ